MTTTRRLAAILAADVAGYSRLMGLDEEGTLERLKGHRRELIDAKVIEHRGRVVKTTGDGILIEFPSVVDAVRCAVEVQSGMAERNAGVLEDERIDFRVGINLGDIIIDGDDIHGDGVNIAARLEGLAEPGGICISRKVCEEVGEKLDVGFEDLGDQSLKNIAQPIRIYRVRFGGRTAVRSTLALPDKPSIAVLPFQNMSGDPEQDYFADGVVEEIITALCRFRQLFIIARNSSFTYKGRAVDVKQVGRDLGVRYVLEGSVRKAANRLRITGQLIDTSTGAHLWADRFEGGLEDVFELQDQVTASVVGAVAPRVEQAEIARARRKPTESLDAYDYFLRGIAKYHRISDREAQGEALHFFKRAIELDPEFALAYAMAALCYLIRKINGWRLDPAIENAEAVRLARRAVEIVKDDALVLGASGLALAHMGRDLVAGVALTDRALELNPNLAAAWNWSGWLRMWLGEPDAAIERVGRAVRLSPLDPYTRRFMQNATAYAHFVAGRYDEASSWASRALQDDPDFQACLRVSAVSNALAGRMDEAQKALARLRRLHPTLRVSHISEIFGPGRPEDLKKYEDGMRKAGLPE